MSQVTNKKGRILFYHRFFKHLFPFSHHCKCLLLFGRPANDFGKSLKNSKLFSKQAGKEVLKGVGRHKETRWKIDWSAWIKSNHNLKNKKKNQCHRKKKTLLIDEKINVQHNGKNIRIKRLLPQSWMELNKAQLICENFIEEYTTHFTWKLSINN